MTTELEKKCNQLQDIAEAANRKYVYVRRRAAYIIGYIDALNDIRKAFGLKVRQRKLIEED